MTPVLYIMMRNDLDSHTNGKKMAQASHASNAFVHHITNSKTHLDKKITDGYIEWMQSTSQGFGTVLVLESNMKEINIVVDTLNAMGYVAGVVHDPTYPILDGKVVHHIPLDTCAYIFVPDKKVDLAASAIMSKYNLHQ